jgi:hypothetical protein
MIWVLPTLLILGGILAASSLIVAKKPDAKEMIAKIAPYQAIIGIILLLDGIYYTFIYIGIGNLIKAPGQWLIGGLCLWGMMVSSILLGIMFGMPMVAKMSASGAAKGEEMAKKLAPFQTLIGLVAIGSAFLAVLINLSILKP